MDPAVEWYKRMKAQLWSVPPQRARMLGAAFVRSVEWAILEEGMSALPADLHSRVSAHLAGPTADFETLHRDLGAARSLGGSHHAPAILASSYLIAATLHADSLDDAADAEARHATMLGLAEASMMALIELLFPLGAPEDSDLHWGDELVGVHEQVLTGLVRISVDQNLDDQTAAGSVLEASQGWSKQLHAAVRERSSS